MNYKEKKIHLKISEQMSKSGFFLSWSHMAKVSGFASKSGESWRDRDGWTFCSSKVACFCNMTIQTTFLSEGITKRVDGCSAYRIYWVWFFTNYNDILLKFTKFKKILHKVVTMDYKLIPDDYRTLFLWHLASHFLAFQNSEENSGA